ncbi:MAG TPA: hypothetical protein VGF32_31835 [Streptosporangiaceae bacterium]
MPADYDVRAVYLKCILRHCYANVTRAGSPESRRFACPGVARRGRGAARRGPGAADQAIVRDISR